MQIIEQRSRWGRSRVSAGSWGREMIETSAESILVPLSERVSKHWAARVLVVTAARTLRGGRVCVFTV